MIFFVTSIELNLPHIRDTLKDCGFDHRIPSLFGNIMGVAAYKLDGSYTSNVNEDCYTWSFSPDIVNPNAKNLAFSLVKNLPKPMNITFQSDEDAFLIFKDEDSLQKLFPYTIAILLGNPQNYSAKDTLNYSHATTINFLKTTCFLDCSFLDSTTISLSSNQSNPYAHNVSKTNIQKIQQSFRNQAFLDKNNDVFVIAG